MLKKYPSGYEYRFKKKYLSAANKIFDLHWFNHPLDQMHSTTYSDRFGAMVIIESTLSLN